MVDHPHDAEVTDTPPEGARTVRLVDERVEIDALHDLVAAEAEEHGYGRQTRFGLRLAMEEAISNGFRHGHRDLDASVPLEVAWHVGPERIWIRVTDAGPGFDPEGVPDPTRLENLELGAGRGLLLMRSYMSSVEFNERGNRVTMIRRRHDHAARR